MIRRTLRVSPGLLINMFMKEDLPKFYSITKDELPLDAKIVDVIPQWMGEIEESMELTTIDLVIESKEFTEDTPEPLPPIEITQVVAVINIDYLVTSKEEPNGKVQS